MFVLKKSCRCVKKTIKDRDGLRVCVSVLMSLPRAYEDPQQPGALGGVQPFAQAHKLRTPQAQKILQSVLSYTLHNPDGRDFLLRPRWSLTETNNGKWIWSTCKNSVDGIRGTTIC